MAGRLSNLNGWQRLWLVGTICLGLYLIGWLPLTTHTTAQIAERDYQRRLEKDLANPACKEYQTRPFLSLVQPEFDEDGGACWHLFTSRKYDDTKTIPFTMETYERRQQEHWRNIYLAELAVGTVGTVAISGLIYLAGWVVGWIIRGFRLRA